MSVSAVLNRVLSFTLPALPSDARFSQPILAAGVIAIGLAIAWLPPEESIILLGGITFWVLLLRIPLLSLYVLIPVIPFSTLLAVSLNGFKVGLMEIVLALGLIAWLLQILTRQNLQYRFSESQIAHFNPQPFDFAQDGAPIPNPQSPPLLWPFVILLASAGLSWLNTLSIGASVIETIKWVEMLALYLFTIALLPARHIKWVVAALLLTGLAQAGLGLYQFIFKVGPEGFLLFGGRFLRAYGTFAQPNPYAGYLGLILPLALSLTAWGLADFGFSMLDFRLKNKSKMGVFHLSRRGGEVGGSYPPSPPACGTFDSFEIHPSKTLVLLPAGIALGLLLAALFATQSRGAWLGFAVATVVTLVVYSKKTALFLAALAAVGAIAGSIGVFDLASQISRTTPAGEMATPTEVITQRLVEAVSIATIADISTLEVTDANFAAIERLAHWQAAREMWRDNPWLGVGFGNYAVVYPAYAVGRWLNPLGHAHNYLLNLGAEAGLAGIIGYLIFWIFAFRVAWLAVRRSGGFNRAVAAGGLGILVHLHIHNLFDNLYVQGMYLHVAVILALISIIYYHPHQNLSTTNKGES